MAEHRTNIDFEIEGVSQTLHVYRLDGWEALSELFAFELSVAAHDVRGALRNVVGSAATLHIAVNDDKRTIHGIVARFRQGASGQRHAVYRVTFVPAAQRLLYRQDSRIFQDKGVPKIVEEVLGEAGLTDYRLALEGEHPDRPYCVQYAESDWAFVSRLCEEEGIFYFFEDAGSATAVVFGDGSSAHDPIAGEASLPFRPHMGALASREAITQIEAVEALQPGKVTLRDYNFEKPELSLETSTSAERHDALEVFDCPGGYGTPGDGERLAQVRIEEHGAGLEVVEGETGTNRFAPGFTFKLEDHPLEELNAEYVVTRLSHSASLPLMGEAADGEQGYVAQFTAIRKEVPFRPPRLTPKPRVHMQTAMVVGPSGKEIHADEHGRVKVQFHWDRRGQKDEKSSTWIRVSQVWAGAGWGAMQLPRIGQEVVVDFLEGDIDRPLVVGRVYNGKNVPPYKLPDDVTKSTLKSLSSPEGEAGNELRFEDKKDSEEIYLHAQKDLVVAIENDETRDIVNARTTTIGADDTLEVTGKRTVTVKDALEESVEKDATLDYKKKYTMTVADEMSLEVTKDFKETISGKRTVEVSGEKLELSCGASKMEVEDSKIKLKGDSETKLEGGDAKVKLDGKVKIEGDKIELG